MFITTANVLDTIPGPLRDRMEIVHIPGYTEAEKVAIARRYLVPRQKAENGLLPGDLFLSDALLGAIVHSYTREAGVRNLEREIATICRKIARKISESLAQNEKSHGKQKGETEQEAVADRKPMRRRVTLKNLASYLGPVRFEPEMGNRVAQIGVATGMAWTPMGGEILFIESAKMPGHGLTTTGQLGDVMRESAQIAYDFLKSHRKELGLPKSCGEECAIHIHVPAGAIPKDGPSAGVAMTVALASLLSGRPARHDISLTGEVTLTGRVLPVGGVKEKVLAARQAGIKTIVLPERNRSDLLEIPAEARGELKFIFVSDVREAIKHVLLAVPSPSADKTPPDKTTPLEQDTESAAS
jgi:ATP-dependent Lon protease